LIQHGYISIQAETTWQLVFGRIAEAIRAAAEDIRSV